MKRFFCRSGLVAVALITILAVAVPCAGGAESWPKKETAHILLISIDGLSYETYSGMNYGALQALAADGVLCEKGLAVRAGEIPVGEASLLTGRNPEDHGLGGSGQVDAQSVLDIVKNHGRSLLVVDGSGGELKCFDHGPRSYIEQKKGTSDLEVMKAAVKNFSERRPFFTYVYLGGPRRLLGVKNQEQFYTSLAECQQAVGLMVRELKKMGVYDRSIIVVASPRSSSSTHLVPIIIKSPGLQKGVEVQGLKVTDVASNICVMAGLPRPIGSGGVVLWSALAADNKAVAVGYLEQQVKELFRDRLDQAKKTYRLEDNRDELLERLGETENERRSIFDFAGQKEKTVADLKKRIFWQRSAFAGLILVLIAGYYVEYRVLKKRYTLF